jgi:riboflavin biosynthesis pyrimidine reductase
MRFQQLIPEPGEVTIENLIGSLRFADQATPDRPYVLANFVSSVDGRASFQGRSGQLGDDGDRAVFRTLRREVDAVLVGTGTARAENYGRLIKDPAARARRVARGLPAEPIACMLTRGGDVPTGIPLFAEPEARVVVFSGAKVELGEAKAQVEVVPLADGEVTFSAALAHLRRHENVRALLCEGGPGVLSALLHERVLDELFLTLAPQLTGGGDGPSLTSGAELAQPAHLQLAGALQRAGSLFLRYQVD